VALYNTATPDECPAVERLSRARRQKAATFLAAFPGREFWEETFQQIHGSPFLRGKRRKDGQTFVCSLDWLLTRGRDGSENVVKVHEGHYRG
jgi:hypothetical protein